MAPADFLAPGRWRWRQSRPYTRWLALSAGWAARQYAGCFEEVGCFCLFLGHGRSSHSLVAALFDAHPQVVMADEIDSLRLVAAGFSRDQLYAHIAAAAARHARRGRRKGAHGRSYQYRVPDQWQGRFAEVRAIGEASLATARLHADPTLLDKVLRLVGVPVRFIQVVRNPYDAIGRLHLLTEQPLNRVIKHYFHVCERTAVIRQRLETADLLLIRHEALIGEPDSHLEQMLAFVGLAAPVAYRQACAAILFDKPRQVRNQVAWSTAQLDAIAAGIERYDFLNGYVYDR